MLPRDGDGPLTAVLAVVSLGVIFLAFAWWAVARGGSPSDEQAVRTWFTSPAGGGAPGEAVSAIHVSGCTYAAVDRQSRTVLRCATTTDAPNPTLHACFVFSGGKVLRGGWQLASLDACNGLRYDSRTGDLFDTVGRVHYHLSAD